MAKTVLDYVQQVDDCAVYIPEENVIYSPAARIDQDDFLGALRNIPWVVVDETNTAGYVTIKIGHVKMQLDNDGNLSYL